MSIRFSKAYFISFGSVVLLTMLLAYAYAISRPHPKKDFVTDGCSMWPDGDYKVCCIAHDKVYWTGGTAQERLKSDLRLQQCVSAKSGRLMGSVMYVGVRIGGHPIWPVPWRWNFGEPYLKDIRDY